MTHRALAQPVRRTPAAVGAVALALILLAAPAACAADELRIQTGPILGAFDAGWFTVACRTSVKAPVTVALAATDAEPEKVVAESAPAMIHRLKVPRAAGASQKYVLIAPEGVRVPLAAPAPVAKGETFAFVAMGDSRTYPKRWAAVAAAALKARPRFVLFTGDMVAHGLDDASWDRDFFGPARELFAATPFYCVMGNHEENGPLFNEMFYNPSPDGRTHSWAQTLGDVTLIGVDGEQDWSAGSENARWLEKVLAASDSKFIFLASHYPPWTSSTHGGLDAEGRPRERAIREGREVIMPLLAKYRATAFLAGHDHCYERSEPEGGVTAITTGGAGAPLYPKVRDAARQNPWSKVFASQLHYCVIEVSGDACTLKAFTPEGDLLDARTWKARPSP
jgi:3',5'-cyclic AMP phosphodiesterase CpdA